MTSTLILCVLKQTCQTTDIELYGFTELIPIPQFSRQPSLSHITAQYLHHVAQPTCLPEFSTEQYTSQTSQLSSSTSCSTALIAFQIPWDGAVRAGNLTEDQLKKIKSVDKVRKDQRKQTIEKDVQSYGILLAGGSAGGSVLEKASKRSDILQYILVLATDLINGEFLYIRISRRMLD